MCLLGWDGHLCSCQCNMAAFIRHHLLLPSVVGTREMKIKRLLIYLEHTLKNTSQNQCNSIDHLARQPHHCHTRPLLSCSLFCLRLITSCHFHRQTLLISGSYRCKEQRLDMLGILWHRHIEPTQHHC